MMLNSSEEALESLGYSIWDEEGNYGEATANAVYRFYLDRGYYLPGILTEPKKDATTLPCRSLNTSSLTAMNTP